MGFETTVEQTLLRDAMAAYLADHYGFEARRRIVESEAGWSSDVWRAFAEELGILGVGLPESLGGLGGGAREVAVIMEALGAALAIEPFLETVVIGGGLVKEAHGAATLIGQIAAGEARLAFAIAEPEARYAWQDVETRARPEGGGYRIDGRKAVVTAAPMATHLLVTARTGGARRDPEGVSIFLVERGAEGLSMRSYRTVDERRAAEVTLEGVLAPAEALVGVEDQGLGLVERVIDEATAAVCAEACGVLGKLLDDTVQYAKERHQFGAPIGKFQALQHRMADMYIQLQLAISMAETATNAVGRPPLERARAVSAAKAQIGKACKVIGHGAIQVHGGMGITDELAASHYFRRAIAIESQFGSTDHHLARFERLGRAGLL